MDRLVMTRVVKWGDCDPAGIIYTPRVFDYATEALEAWYRDVGGIDWVSMNQKHNLGAPTVHAACDFLRPMVPDLTIHVAVWLIRVGGSSLTFRVIGEDGEGRRFFDVKMVSCITDFRKASAIPIPPPIRERAEAYHRAWGEPA